MANAWLALHRHDRDRYRGGPEGKVLRLGVQPHDEATVGPRDAAEESRELRRQKALTFHSGEVVSILGADGHLSYVSPSAERVFGCAPIHVGGPVEYDCIHPDDRGKAVEAIQRASRDGAATGTMRIKHADGSWRWMEQTMVRRFDDPAIAGIVINSRDVTDRTLAETRLAALNRLHSVVSATNQALVRATEPAAFLNRVCAIAVECGGFRVAWIGSVLHERGVVRPMAMRKTGIKGPIPLTFEVSLADHPAFHTVAQTGFPVISNNVAEDDRVASFRKFSVADGPSSLGLFPLCGAETVIGVLVLYSDAGDHWDDDQQALATQLAQDVSFGLQTLDERRRRCEAESEAVARTRQQSAVSALGILALEIRDRREFLQAAIAAVVDTLDVAHATVFEAVSDQGVLRVAATDREREGIHAGQLIPASRLPMTDYALRTGTPVLVADRRTDPRFLASQFSWASAYASGLSVIIAAKGRRYGALTVHHARPDFFTVDDQCFLESVAHLIAWVSERGGYEDAMSHRALHDTATDLPNRVLFRDRLAQAIARNTRAGVKSAVFCVDLNGFTPINDSMGHANGDLILVEMARRLTGCARASDTVARFIGDQFAILYEDVRTAEIAPRVAQKVLDRISRPFVVAGREIALTASIGIALVSSGASPDDVLRDAADAMHRAKKLGRGGYEMADGSLRERALQRLEIEEGLRHAIADGGLRVHYQPVIDVASGAVVGVEALVRWQHPTRGLVAPVEFIPLAEESGLIVPMGRWVLEEACRTVARWNRRRRGRPLSLAVNLSTRQLTEPGVASMVSKVLRRTGLTPSCLALEITESRLMEDAKASSDVLTQLHALGVRLSVDDFGTGYSSLLYLRRFPVDALKVDRAFIGGLDSNCEDTAIVHAVIALGHALGLEVVAEGVETPEQLASLRLLGCDLAQGFLWSKPLAGPEAELLLGLDVRSVTPTGVRP